ncbi:McrB family protein [Nostoc sp.]
MNDKKNQQSLKDNQINRNNNPIKEIQQLSTKAQQEILNTDLSDIDNSLAPDGFTVEDCWYKAKIFERATQRLEEKLQQLNDLKKKERQLESNSQELEQKSAELEQKEIELNNIKPELELREYNIQKRELDAQSGFTQERDLILVGIEEQRQEIAILQQQIADEKRQLRAEQRKLETDREIIEEDRLDLANKIEQRAAIEVDKLKLKIQIIEEQLQLAQTQRNHFQSLLIKKQEAERRFGHKTPEEILEQLEILQKDKLELEQKLASRPSESATARLQELETQKEGWESERFRLTTELQELKISITYNRIAVTELETLRDEKEALDASNNRLRAALQELRANVEEATGKDKDKSPFPECLKMDNDQKLQTAVSLVEKIPNLQQFAEDLRYRIALSTLLQDSNTQKRLYYSERDIRAFLGGLAMSHLHILQGISGTGKTSLPVAFARAVGGQYKLVEVQAGWRDRQDILGYFNAFEGRFYESDFLKALYEARCPANQERIYIIILDEMNLSRPEQYFADFLSKLEQDAPTINLTTDLDKPSPKLFQNQNILPIPDNVWFIGTANQDETTLEFADKTYDRAHIMELQRNYESFNITTALEYREPVSYQALVKAFENAQNQYADKASEAYKFLNDTLAEFMQRRFKVAWGNRLERQIHHFVPVVIATGGSLGEATDHILATKIFRKIRDRHDTLTSDLKKLKEDLLQYWSILDSSTEPVQSLAIINAEISRLEPI